MKEHWERNKTSLFTSYWSINFKIIKKQEMNCRPRKKTRSLFSIKYPKLLAQHNPSPFGKHRYIGGTYYVPGIPPQALWVMPHLTNKIGIIAVSILQVRKPRPREV